MWRIIPIIISLFFLALFIAPFSVSIVTVGNCAGAVISALLALIFIFFGKFKILVLHLCESKCGKLLVGITGGISAFCIVLALIISIFMISAMNDSPKGQPTTIVLLGCQVRGTSPSLMLKRRINTAYDYLSEYADTKVIVSGGQGDDEAISEAQCMRDELLKMGINPDRIYMEDKSTNTYENLKFSQEIINREGLESNITIVTDGYHQLRAEMFAEKLGMKSYNLSAHTSYWLVPTYWVREWFAVVYYAIFG